MPVHIYGADNILCSSCSYYTERQRCLKKASRARALRKEKVEENVYISPNALPKVNGTQSVQGVRFTEIRSAAEPAELQAGAGEEMENVVVAIHDTSA